MRRILIAFGILLALIAAYLTAWPVPVDPVAWEPPPNPGFTGPFARNERLAALETIELGGLEGPEATAEGPDGYIYVATESGIIARLHPDADTIERWADTGGRPLGLAFDAAGILIVADAVRGLISVSPDARLDVLVDRVDDSPIGLADDVAIADDGRIYFSDATTKFTRASGTENASTLDVVEHGGHGRLIEYDPATRTASILLDGLQFANGVAISHDQQSVLVVETGSYRVLRVFRDGARRGEHEVFVDALPGFPDNITAGMDGRYWIALFAPRVPILDATARRPFLRKVLLRIPSALRPSPQPYGHVIAVNDAGNVVLDLQDPSPRVFPTTSVLETPDYLFIGALRGPVLGRVSKSRVGL